MHPDGAPPEWESTAKALRRRAKKASDNTALRPILAELLAVMKTSHYHIVPKTPSVEPPRYTAGPGRAAGGAAGVAVRLTEDALLVWRVVPGSPAEAAGLRVGDRIVQLEDVSVAAITTELPHEGTTVEEQLLLRAWAESHLDGDPESTATLTLSDGRELAVGRVSEPVFVSPPVGNYGGSAEAFWSFRVHSADGPVQVIAFTQFAAAVIPRFTAAVADARQTRGLVLDLRGNPGGIQAVGRGISSFLVDAPTDLGRIRGRYGELDLAVSPRARSQRLTTDAGLLPVAILIDRTSASTSEFVAAGLAQQPHIEVFGEKSAGMAVQSRFETLPNGDVLQLVGADYVAPDGTRIEGTGVRPTRPVATGPDALQSGEDPVLTAAIEWIVETTPTPPSSAEP